MSGATHRDTQEIDRVLGSLTGHDLFRRNAFRVTGLPTDAGERTVRRAREESRSRYYVPPSVPAGVPLPPSADPDELRAAFEVLRDPVARLVHELLWARFTDGGLPGVQVRAVTELCLALEGTSPDGVVRDAEALRRWHDYLRLWADVLRADATWELAARRAAELDDPRLTPATLDALRTRLPEHLVGVVAGLAARRAAAQPDDARRWRDLARGAGFDGGDVRRAFRAAARPDLDGVEAACEVARAADAERVGTAAAETLLAAARPRLERLSGLLGADDDLVVGRHDDVALAVNNCVVRFVNANAGHSAAAGALLREARDLARSPAHREHIGANLRASGAAGTPGSETEMPGWAAALGCLGVLVAIGLLLWAGTAFAVGVLDMSMPGALLPGAFFGLVLAGVLSPIFGLFTDS